MTDEDGFLAHLRAHPTDAVARLAFADWLEERGAAFDDIKATYLRLDAAVAELPDDHPSRDGKIQLMSLLANKLPLAWKSAVVRLPLENCDLLWDFVCPKRWEHLTPTDDAKARHCPACRKTVHYCGSIQDAQQKAWLGECVVVDLQVKRRPGDLDIPRMQVMGRIVAPTVPPVGTAPPVEPPTVRGRRNWARRRQRGTR
jgi:uncharacterized protein (TIGR02996 family)